MKIEYQTYDFELSFSAPVVFNVPLTYLFRSLLGKELKFISCVLKNQSCPTCPLKNTCAYSFIFDNPIDKDNEILTGRKNATPPYLLHSDVVYGENITSAKLVLTLIGRGIEFFPHILLAFQRAGQSGILKDRVVFKINSIHVDRKKFPLDSSFKNIPINAYVYSSSSQTRHSSIVIMLESPFRYKRAGVYAREIDYMDIINACVRRLNILSGFYGDGRLIEHIETYGDEIEAHNNLVWVDREHYSARQRKSMQLGGLVGTVLLKGTLGENTLSLLGGGSIFHIGKSISFGLGKIKIMEGV